MAHRFGIEEARFPAGAPGRRAPCRRALAASRAAASARLLRAEREPPRSRAEVSTPPRAGAGAASGRGLPARGAAGAVVDRLASATAPEERRRREERAAA